MDKDNFKYLIPIPWIIMTSVVSITEYNKFITKCNEHELSKPNDLINSLCFAATFTELIIVVGFISLPCAIVVRVAILIQDKIKRFYENFEL
jgi:hypothetical protein